MKILIVYPHQYNWYEKIYNKIFSFNDRSVHHGIGNIIAYANSNGYNVEFI